jgi:GNAT superfamily N-acetyltransferase
MRDDLPPAWQTDLAILEYSGSTIEDHGDYLLLRSPHNPDFHWGNCLFVLDGEAVDDATRWVKTFQSALPEANWVAIGLIQMPTNQDGWDRHGIAVEPEDVLTTRFLPRQLPLPEGYTVRRLSGQDWAQSVSRSVAENRLSKRYDQQMHERFSRAQARTRAALSERELGAWFGGFAGDELVAYLGIVRCGTTARYQSVLTAQEHRGRGLASHLLGVAALWAAEHGCDRWVIVTDVTNPAGRVYRRLGFEPDVCNARAYRSPG